MRRFILVLLALFALFGCRPTADAPQRAGRVTLQLSASPNLVVEHEIRIAVVWLVQRDEEDAPIEYLVTLDQSITSTDTPVSLSLLPPAERIDELTPVESIGFGFNGLVPTFGRAYRPRFIVYEDLDDTRSFDVASIEEGRPDRIIGGDSSFNAFVAYVFDLDVMLSQLTTEQFAAYEVATEGVYTPFVGVLGAYDDLGIAPPREASIGLDDTDVPAASVRCRHQIFGVESPPIDASVLVNPPLDPLVVCGIDATSCEAATLMSLPAPVVVDEEDEPLAGVTCRRNSQLEMLSFFAQRVACNGCACVVDRTVRAFATTATAAPDWWPCPETIPYCLEGPVGAFTSTCAVARLP